MRTFYIMISSVALLSCAGEGSHDSDALNSVFYRDTVFFQEYHEASPIGPAAHDNQVASIVVDRNGNVWAATRAGVFVRRAGDRGWVPVLAGADSGPAFAVAVDGAGSVWMSTWKSVYKSDGGAPVPVPNVKAPISTLIDVSDGVYALGPNGVWLCKDECARQTFPLARSARSAAVAPDGSLWMGTDVGLYHVAGGKLRHLYNPAHLISAYVKGVDFDQEGHLWVGGLGGVTILDDTSVVRKLKPADGLSSSFVTAVKRAPDGAMWVGTEKGVVRFKPDGSHSLLFSRRWLLNDHVTGISFDKDGNAWVATQGGVSVIRRKPMTLESKARYFHDVLMRRHIREPWIAGQCKLPVAGDTTVWAPDDDDNDGEYTGMYLAMEAFRYAATGDADAKVNARKAFKFLQLLQRVTDTDGFFARTIVPSHWTEVDDPNRTYTEQERAYELIKEPRFKPVEVRWHRSADGRWLWKGDTSSDEMCGHMFGYYFYYTLVADEAERVEIRAHVARIVDHLIANDFTLTDVDGTHTRWAVWSPSRLNRDPEWLPDRSLNSMELLAYLKLAAWMTGEQKYEDHYRRLIEVEGYLDNMAGLHTQNPAWFIYYDVMLAAYMYPILLKCETDPALLEFYQRHMDTWFERFRPDHNPLINFLYCYSRDKREALDESVTFLRETPLDLIDWPINHTEREDVRVVRQPVLEDLQVDQLPPPAIRAAIRWDKNPYAAITGNPHVEREPVFWLLPYWMGRYLDMIGAPANE